MHSAGKLGAELVCPGQFISARLTGSGTELVYRSGDTEHSCHASVLVNAAGAWVNQVLERITPPPQQRPIEQAGPAGQDGQLERNGSACSCGEQKAFAPFARTPGR